MSVHILGAGAMGMLVAHELAVARQMTPTLLLRSRSRLEAYKQAGLAVSVLRRDDSGVSTSKMEMGAICSPPLDTQGKPVHIDNLILSTKAHVAVDAVRPYVQNLSSSSTLLLLQNGMGVSAALQDALWPLRLNMPSFFQAISTHGAYKPNPTTVHHVGLGSLVMAPLGTAPDSASPPPLLRALEACLALQAQCMAFEPFLLRQIEKLVANACINPLTAVLDCLNGDLLYGTKIPPIMKRVIRECVDCFRAEYAVLSRIPNARTYLDRDRLLASVVELCKNTSQNSLSMREDVRHLHRTEIDWINGYIVTLGYRHGIPTPTNRMLVEMVKNKVAIEQAKENLALKRDRF